MDFNALTWVLVGFNAFWCLYNLLVGSKKACGSLHRISHENWKKEKTNKKKTKRTKTQKNIVFGENIKQYIIETFFTKKQWACFDLTSFKR